MSKATHRVTVALNDEEYAALEAVTSKADDGPTQSKFIKAALRERLGIKPDTETELLLDRFARLNDDGRAWLLEAAKIAAASDEARQITPRNRKKTE